MDDVLPNSDDSYANAEWSDDLLKDFIERNDLDVQIDEEIVSDGEEEMAEEVIEDCVQAILIRFGACVRTDCSLCCTKRRTK